MTVWRWADKLVDIPAAHRITLGEGNTPLIPSRRIGLDAGLSRLFFKLETTNPTGSYKDRFAAVAIADMLAHGRRHCLATSSGNAGSSIAAYCAAVGMPCDIAIVETAPAGKLQQMLAFGANLYRIRGFGLDTAITDQTFAFIQDAGRQPGRQFQISNFLMSPVGMVGVQSISYEIAEQTPVPVDHVFSPSGGGGLTLAVARGFERLRQDGEIEWTPAIECVQPEGNDTIAGPLRAGKDRAHPVECTTTISGLQVPIVADGHEVIQACRATGGTGHLVSDELVYEMHRRLAREEGVFAEPAGATALAGAIQAARAGEIAPNAMVICLVTGAGFKDPPSVERLLADTSVPTLKLDELRERL